MATKNNHANRSSKDAGVELGAWILSTGFFVCILWIALNVLHRIMFY
ncbi:MAG: hypothetical protein K1X61_09210 [Chitinophagales bacterium]|nr:hypothetical protein [Chitinophagales bacterium]